MRKVLGLLIFLLIIGCSVEEKEVELKSISLGVQDSSIVSLIWIADSMGYFEDECLNVTIKRYPSGKLALNGIFDKEVEFAATSEMPIMVNSFERDDFAVFATIAHADNAAWIIARKDRVKQKEDLNGKVVGTQENSAVHFFLSMFKLYNGLDFNITFMPAVELVDALIEGRIDAFSMRNPFIQDAKDKLKENYVEFFQEDAYRQTFNLVAFKERLSEDDSAEKILRALIKSEELFLEDKDSAFEAAVKGMGVERVKELELGWSDFEFQVGLGQDLILLLEDEAEWKVGDKGKIPNYLYYLDLSVLDAVDKDRVGVIR